MKTFAISIDFSSNVHTLAELVEIVGLQPDEGSHDRGELHPNGRQNWAESRLRVQSEADEGAPIEEHLRALTLKRPRADFPSGIDITVTIAVFFETPFATVRFPFEALRALPLREYTVEFAAYP